MTKKDMYEIFMFERIDERVPLRMTFLVHLAT